MKFSPFAEKGCGLVGGYERAAASQDKERSEALYAEIRKIYDKEKYKILGKGKAIRHFLENTQLYINPDDIFCDHFDKENTPLRLRREDYHLYHKRAGEERVLENIGAIFARGDYGHTSPDWKRLFSLGFIGIIEEAREGLAKVDASGEEGAFYSSVIEAYRGIISLCRRLSVMARSADTENSRFAADNLLAISERAPRTLAEAMQIYFIFYAVQQYVDGANLRSLGSVDILLYDFFLADTESGEYSEEQVRELIRYFLMKWNSMKILANIPFDLSSKANELTYLILEEYIALGVPDPKIHIKCYDGMPKRLISTVMKSIRSGNNSFVFMNDRIIRESLMRVGISREDSENYTLIGCYEPSVIGLELPCTVNGKLSLPKAVEAVLSSLYEEGRIDEIGYDELLDLIFDKIKHFADVAMTEISTVERKYPSFIQTPTMSATFKCCMENAKDAYAGGMKYNSSSLCPFGIATFTDELLAIRGAVYDERMLTLGELYEILKGDWADNEQLRRTMERKYPKYGTANPEADALAKKTLEFLSDTVNGHPNGRGGSFKLGLFSIDWIFEFGKKLIASADGRHTGDPVSKNLSSAVGRDNGGVTALMRSVLSLDHSMTPNGTVLDIALHPSAISGDEGIEIMIGLLNTYLAGGGFALQMNVVSKETLVAAQKDPDKYRNLQVRLCGWNVYFTDLEREIQDNLIASVT